MKRALSAVLIALGMLVLQGVAGCASDVAEPTECQARVCSTVDGNTTVLHFATPEPELGDDAEWVPPAHEVGSGHSSTSAHAPAPTDLELRHDVFDVPRR